MKNVTTGEAKGGWRILGIWVVLAFVVLAAAWFTLITIANKNSPEPVPLKQAP